MAARARRALAPLRQRGALAVVLTGGLTPEEAMRRVIAACLEQIEANAPGALRSENPEFVHQMRVALRRMRSAWRFFTGTSAPIAQLQFGRTARSLARALGDQRDWDVFVENQLPGLALPEASRRLAFVFKRAARERVRALISAPGYREFVAGMAAWLATPGRHAGEPALRAYSSSRLKRLHRSAMRDADRFLKLDDAARHRARIRVKRVRYAIEALGALFDTAAVKAYSDALGGLQALLGEITDIDAARDMLEGLDLDRTQRIAARRQLRRRKAALIRQAPKRFAKVRRSAGFWKNKQ